MKSRVKFSTGVAVYTLICFLGAAVAFYYLHTSGHEWLGVILWVGFGAWVVGALIYMPLSIKVDDKELLIKRPLWSKRLPLTEIKTVRQLQPTMGERRLFSSGGFMGYWGRYDERDVGRYFAYYGRSSDCFLVRLRNGRQYILGCENPAEMVAAIQERLA